MFLFNSHLFGISQQYPQRGRKVEQNAVAMLPVIYDKLHQVVRIGPASDGQIIATSREFWAPKCPNGSFYREIPSIQWKSRLVKYSNLARESWKWKSSLNERKLMLEIHPFSTSMIMGGRVGLPSWERPHGTHSRSATNLSRWCSELPVNGGICFLVPWRVGLGPVREFLLRIPKAYGTRILPIPITDSPWDESGMFTYIKIP